MSANSGVNFLFDGEPYRPWQYRYGHVCLFGGWAPISIGWMWPITWRRTHVLIVAGRVMLGAAWKSTR